MAEKAKKQRARERDMEIRKTLDAQMKEKRDFAIKEREENKKFIQMVLDKDEKDRKDQKDKDANTRARLVELS